jgi:hypothetical protein
MSNKMISIYSDALKRKENEDKEDPTRQPASNITLTREISSEQSREERRSNPRENSRRQPTRDEIQGFSFRLRDEIKVKVQAEVPHSWQDELEHIAQQLDVKKLELYRFIIGKFLDKV